MLRFALFGLLLVTGTIVGSDIPKPIPLRLEKPADEKTYEVEEGFYLCTSGIPDNKKVRSIVSVKKLKNVYSVIYVQRNGSAITGIGILKGTQFTVGWGAEDARGVAVYNLHKESGELRGEYSMLPGDGNVYPETLKFLYPFKDSEPEPKKE